MLQYAALLSRPPRSIAVREADALPLDVAWPLRSWSSGVLVEMLEHGKVSLQHRNELAKDLRLSLEAAMQRLFVNGLIAYRKPGATA